MNTEQNCIFCKITKGEIPAHKVYEDEYTLAFLDIHPNTKGHTLVVPKNHFENIYSIPPETLARTILVVQKVALALKHGLDADGINIFNNNEREAGQIIDPSHFHVIPRGPRDNFPTLPHVEYAEGEIESVTKSIKENL